MCYHDHDYSVGSSYRNTCEDYQDACTKLQHVEDAMNRVIHMLYGDQEIDRSMLDEAIADICDVVDMDSPTGLPRIRRLRSSIFEFASECSQNVLHTGA